MKEFIIKKSNPGSDRYLYNMSLKSEDEYGTWAGNGFLSFNPKVPTSGWLKITRKDRSAISVVCVTIECFVLMNFGAIGCVRARHAALRTQAN
jgi:hypothetical protein